MQRRRGPTRQRRRGVKKRTCSRCSSPESANETRRRRKSARRGSAARGSPSPTSCSSARCPQVRAASLRFASPSIRRRRDAPRRAAPTRPSNTATRSPHSNELHARSAVWRSAPISAPRQAPNQYLDRDRFDCEKRAEEKRVAARGTCAYRLRLVYRTRDL